MEFHTLLSPPLKYTEPVKYRCKDHEVQTMRWNARVRSASALKESRRRNEELLGPRNMVRKLERAQARKN
ncbi:hypothetical protein PRIPAC_90328, partial [Pristionchus pacificus]|uniref:Uncharacterized protein n=1 Tax=Pristionchus pacificus TaxID=54126 RepID=A0A2A6B6E8_PRIPA